MLLIASGATCSAELLRCSAECVQMKLFQKQEQDKQRAMDMLQGSFDMQLAVLRNLQASVLAYTILRPGLRCCPL